MMIKTAAIKELLKIKKKLNNKAFDNLKKIIDNILKTLGCKAPYLKLKNDCNID